jgi:acetyl esterase/lipase
VQGSLRTACIAAGAALALLPSAVAATPPPAELTLPLTVGTLQDQSLGTSALRVTYTWNGATAKASAPTITLANGERFRIYTCIQTHVHGRNFATKCAQKDVDTRSKALPTIVAGPSVSATAPRPAAGQWGYAYHQVVVQKRKADGSYGYNAGTSLAGLANAAVPLPPEGSWLGTLPPSQGFAYPGSTVGGLNSGAPDSMCVGSFKSGASAPGVSTTALGTGAPAYYEVGEPTSGTAKGVMLIVHGGAWNANGPGSVAGMRRDADRWRAQGWRTVNVSYRPCERAFNDVRWFYDRARQVYGSDLPYCALGASAGGNLALVLAMQRPSLACVINQSGPTHAKTLPDQQAYDPNGGSSEVGPRWLFNMMTAAVGQENTHWYSPALFRIDARVLSAFSERDALVPFEQATDLQGRMRARDPDAYSDVLKLGHGTAATFVHAKVSQAALDEYYEREQRLVAPLVGE